MKLSIVIVSYNTKDYLDRCLQSVYSDCPDCEVIVVDNASGDGSVTMMRGKYPKTKLIASKINLGFGKANNLGAKAAKGEIVFFLNSDTIVNKGSLKKMVRFFQDKPNAGIVGPKVLLEDGGVQPFSFGDDPTLISLILEKFNHRKPQARTKRVDWVTGAALAIRRELFEKIGGFDENIFMYFEDSDLCIRARKTGAQIYLFTGSSIIHFGGKSAGSDRKQKEIYFRGQDYFFQKHYGIIGKLMLKLIRLPYKILKR